MAFTQIPHCWPAFAQAEVLAGVGRGGIDVALSQDLHSSGSILSGCVIELEDGRGSSRLPPRYSGVGRKPFSPPKRNFSSLLGNLHGFIQFCVDGPVSASLVREMPLRPATERVRSSILPQGQQRLPEAAASPYPVPTVGMGLDTSYRCVC